MIKEVRFDMISFGCDWVDFDDLEGIQEQITAIILGYTDK